SPRNFFLEVSFDWQYIKLVWVFLHRGQYGHPISLFQFTKIDITTMHTSAIAPPPNFLEEIDVLVLRQEVMKCLFMKRFHVMPDRIEYGVHLFAIGRVLGNILENKLLRLWLLRFGQVQKKDAHRMFQNSEIKI